MTIQFQSFKYYVANRQHYNYNRFEDNGNIVDVYLDGRINGADANEYLVDL